MSRYDRDIRRSTRRRDDDGLTGCAAIFACLLVILLFVGIVFALVREVNSSSKAQQKITHDSMTVVHTYNGETIRFYVMTDPDTGVQYVVNDRGGMCVRRKDAEQ